MYLGNHLRNLRWAVVGNQTIHRICMRLKDAVCGDQPFNSSSKLFYFQRLGYNLAAFRMNGEFISKAAFNTYSNRNAGINMATYINNLPNNTIVLVAVQDSGEKYVKDAYQALMSIGAKPPFEPNGRRASWCLIGHKGGYRPWIAQDQKDNDDVIAKVSAKIYIEE